jgi:hypothetical protein
MAGNQFPTPAVLALAIRETTKLLQTEIQKHTHSSTNA